MERLQKLLARAGVCSRRAAERLIEEGRVRVNGEVVTRLGSRADPAQDVIRVDGKRIASPSRHKLYLMLNKPRGYVTTMSDPEGRPTVRDLIRGVRERVFPVGRLDYNSEGLLLLTNDGDLARDLMHPSTSVDKTYAVKVRGRPDRPTLDRLAAGIRIDGRRTMPARLRVTARGDNSWLEVSVVEGRKHLVRRMLEAVGHPVLKLTRVRFGGLRLGELPRGQVRPLRADEVDRLRRAPGKGSPGRRGRDTGQSS